MLCNVRPISVVNLYLYFNLSYIIVVVNDIKIYEFY